MHLLVHDAPFSGKAALGPDLLDVNHGALARAESKVLQGGAHNEVVFGIAHGFFPWLRVCDLTQDFRSMKR
jgi:ABC-type taurine transport system ATPase subunit